MSSSVLWLDTDLIQLESVYRTLGPEYVFYPQLNPHNLRINGTVWCRRAKQPYEKVGNFQGVWALLVSSFTPMPTSLRSLHIILPKSSLFMIFEGILLQDVIFLPNLHSLTIGVLHAADSETTKPLWYQNISWDHFQCPALTTLELDYIDVPPAFLRHPTKLKTLVIFLADVEDDKNAEAILLLIAASRLTLEEILICSLDTDYDGFELVHGRYEDDNVIQLPKLEEIHLSGTDSSSESIHAFLRTMDAPYARCQITFSVEEHGEFIERLTEYPYGSRHIDKTKTGYRFEFHYQGGDDYCLQPIEGVHVSSLAFPDLAMQISLPDYDDPDNKNLLLGFKTLLEAFSSCQKGIVVEMKVTLLDLAKHASDIDIDELYWDSSDLEGDEDYGADSDYETTEDEDNMEDIEEWADGDFRAAGDREEDEDASRMSSPYSAEDEDGDEDKEQESERTQDREESYDSNNKNDDCKDVDMDDCEDVDMNGGHSSDGNVDKTTYAAPFYRSFAKFLDQWHSLLDVVPHLEYLCICELKCYEVAGSSQMKLVSRLLVPPPSSPTKFPCPKLKTLHLMYDLDNALSPGGEDNTYFWVPRDFIDWVIRLLKARQKCGIPIKKLIIEATYPFENGSTTEEQCVKALRETFEPEIRKLVGVFGEELEVVQNYWMTYSRDRYR